MPPEPAHHVADPDLGRDAVLGLALDAVGQRQGAPGIAVGQAHDPPVALVRTERLRLAGQAAENTEDEQCGDDSTHFGHLRDGRILTAEIPGSNPLFRLASGP